MAIKDENLNGFLISWPHRKNTMHIKETCFPFLLQTSEEWGLVEAPKNPTMNKGFLTSICSFTDPRQKNHVEIQHGIFYVQGIGDGCI